VKKINTLGGDMHKWTVRAARVALVAAAITAAGTGMANADDTTGDHSILGGEQIHIPIIAPIGLFGNHVNLLSSGIPMGARFAHIRTDNDPDAMAPQMDICGNAISSANGIGTASCKGQATLGGPAQAAPAWAPPEAAPAAPVAEESPSPRIGAPATSVGAPGSPVPARPEAPAVAPPAAPAAAPVAAPVEAPAAAPVEAPMETPIAAPQEAPDASDADMSTSGDFGVLSGNQVKAPVRMPVRICGNAGALGGVATAACEGTASSGRLGHPGAFRSLGAAGLLG
jgi:ChpA-C